MKKIRGVSHPIPTQYAKRIYENQKNVFVTKRYLGKVSKGDKFIIYESQGARAYTGWADIKKIGLMEIENILRKHSEQLILNPEELWTYSKKRFELNVIEFENFQMFNKKVVPKRFVGIGGKYIYEDEFKMIEKNKG